MRPPRDITIEERAKACASLRTVGGIYDYIADFVERDSNPVPPQIANNPASN